VDGKEAFASIIPERKDLINVLSEAAAAK